MLRKKNPLKNSPKNLNTFLRGASEKGAGRWPVLATVQEERANSQETGARQATRQSERPRPNRFKLQDEANEQTRKA
jgi:hypothetical protein